MEKIWLKSYPAGVPAQINPDEYRSLPALIEESCARHAESPAYTSLGKTITYAEYERLSRDFAAWLQQVAKLRKGDRIALMLPNVLQYPIALYAALRAGLTVVNTNPLYTPRELEHQLTDSGAKAIVILENFAHTLDEVIAKTGIEHVVVTGVGDLLGWPKSALVNSVVRYVRKQVPRWELPGAIRYNAALEQGRFLSFAPPSIDHSDIAFLQYTGGTKQLVKLGGRPALHIVVSNAVAVAGNAVTVVLGAQAREMTHLLAHSPASVVVNRHWQEGMGSSLRFGIAALPPACDAVLVLLGDQVGVTADDLKRLASAWRGEESMIAASVYDQHVGVPAIFPRLCFSELAELRGDRDARTVLERNSYRLVRVPMVNAAIDLDTPRDLAALIERFKAPEQDN